MKSNQTVKTLLTMAPIFLSSMSLAQPLSRETWLDRRELAEAAGASFCQASCDMSEYSGGVPLLHFTPSRGVNSSDRYYVRPLGTRQTQLVKCWTGAYNQLYNKLWLLSGSEAANYCIQRLTGEFAEHGQSLRPINFQTWRTE